jgi:Glycosyl hydrolase family 12
VRLRSSLGALVLLSCFGLELASCRPKRGAHAPGADLPQVKAECGNAATVTEAPYRYENNQWGSGKEREKFEQCLLERTVPGRTERGWTWNWPGTNPSVFGYPEIIFGWKPWTGGRSTDRRFPLRLSEMQHLVIQYEVETSATGSYNLAPEVWLVSGRSGAGVPNPSSISAEIMFWVEAAGVAQPGGAVVDRPQIAGAAYELWQLDNAGDNGTGGWRLLSFKLPTTQRAGTVPVDELMRYLVQKGLVNPAHYIAGVEFGNEISGGTGTTWVKKFAVEVTP